MTFHRSTVFPASVDQRFLPQFLLSTAEIRPVLVTVQVITGYLPVPQAVSGAFRRSVTLRLACI